MSEKARHRLALVVVAVVVLAGAAVAATLWLRSTPLAGETKHDFGVVPFHGNSVELEHTFLLTNRSDVPVGIARITKSCGCTQAEATSRLIGPGETVGIDAVLRLSGSGRKQSNIGLVLELDGRETTQRLWVEGVGRREDRLWARITELEIHPGRTVPYRKFIAEVFEDDQEPPAPTITVPEGFSVEFGGWSRVQMRDPDRHLPAVWEGRLMLTMTAEELPEGATMRLELPPDDVLEVDLVGHVVFPRGLRDDLPAPDAAAEDEGGGQDKGDQEDDGGGRRGDIGDASGTPPASPGSPPAAPPGGR